MRKWRSHLGQTLKCWSRSFFQMICRHWSHLTQRPSVLTRFSPELSSCSTGSRLNHAIGVSIQCSRASEGLSPSASVLDPALRLDPLGVSVLHFSHFGHRVGDL